MKNRFLTAGEMFRILSETSDRNEVLSEVPEGPKTNFFILIKVDNENSPFRVWDDCGAFDPKRSSVIKYFTLTETDIIPCKKFENSHLSLHYYYCYKRAENFTRLISYFIKEKKRLTSCLLPFLL